MEIKASVKDIASWVKKEDVEELVKAFGLLDQQEEENICEYCGLEHSDQWEAMDCYNFHNDPDYDPWDI